MTGPSASASYDFRCPDCGEAVPVTVTFTTGVPTRAGGAEVRVGLDTGTTVAGFTEHVMSAPEAHPSFTKPAA